jgi:hypothetical protein
MVKLLTWILKTLECRLCRVMEQQKRPACGWTSIKLSWLDDGQINPYYPEVMMDIYIEGALFFCFTPR